MRIQWDESKCTVFFEGEINSYNAENIEEEYSSLLEGKTPDPLIFDFQKVTYISSAGLRIVLRAKQHYPSLSIINASLEVYDVFSMTGFTSMMPVSKALAEVAVYDSQIIGEGYFSTVYRINKDTIIKVFKRATSIEDIERELNLARQAFVAGIPTAITFDVVKVGDKLGVRFEMLDCVPLRDFFRDKPGEFDIWIKRYADLVKKINGTVAMDDSLPSCKTFWKEKAKSLVDDLDKKHYEKLLALLDSIPETNTYVHGDCHVKNILVQGEELLLIDMDTLSRGNPLFEFAGIYATYILFEESDHGNSKRFLDMEPEISRKIYDTLFALCFGEDNKEAYRKAAILSYCHLAWWNQKNEKENLGRREFVIKHLAALLDEEEGQ